MMEEVVVVPCLCRDEVYSSANDTTHLVDAQGVRAVRILVDEKVQLEERKQELTIVNAVEGALSIPREKLPQDARLGAIRATCEVTGAQEGAIWANQLSWGWM